MSSGNLRASDADRDAVAEVLHAAFADGRLTMAEHDQRVSATLKARTFADLTPLTGDLIAIPTTELVGRHGMSPVIVPEGAEQDPDRINTILSNAKRDGKWRMRRISYANTFLGDIKLDLTEATFDARVVELNLTTVMGTCMLRVPTGTRVKDETHSVLGSTSIKGVGDPDPGMPLIVIKGTNVMGEVKVRGPRKLPPWRKALT